MPDAGKGVADDVNARMVGATAAVVLIVIALALLMCHVLVRSWHGHPNGANAPLDAPPPAPMLASAPQADRASYTAEKQRLLENYAWVDRERGIARIPIEHAMALTMARYAKHAGLR